MADAKEVEIDQMVIANGKVDGGTEKHVEGQVSVPLQHMEKEAQPPAYEEIVNPTAAAPVADENGVMVANGGVACTTENEECGLGAKILKKYSTFLVKYPSVVITLSVIIIALSAVLAVVEDAGGKGTPDFSEPTKGYEARGTDIGNKRFVVKNFQKEVRQGNVIKYQYTTRKRRSDVSENSRSRRNIPTWAINNYMTQMDNYKNDFKFVFERRDGGNMLEAPHLIDMCRWYKNEVQQVAISSEFSNVHHIPNYIAMLEGFADCEQVNQTHIDRFVDILKDCVGHYRNNSLLTCMKCALQNGPSACASDCSMPQVCRSHPNLSPNYNMVPLLHNVFHHLAGLGLRDDPGVLQTAATVTIGSVWNEDDFFDSLYKNKLKDLDNTRFAGIQIKAFTMGDFKFDLFGQELISQSALLIIAIVIVIVCGWIFSGSLFLGLMTFGCIVAAMLVSWFVYNRVFDMPFFPFLNITILIFIIGIGADDVFVYTGEWEEAKRALVLRDEKETEKFMIKWTVVTLRHAAMAMFVTSLTTAAAFYANASSDVMAVKCFGVFSGTAIIVNYMLMITLFPCCVVVHEKYFSRCMNCCCPTCCTRLPVVQPEGQEGPMHVNGCKQRVVDLSSAFFDRHLSKLLVQSPLRFVLLLVFFILGVVGIVVSFADPGLNPPSSASFQMFASTSSIEQYDLYYKKKFAAGSSDDGRDVSVVFVFGVDLVDNADHYDPKDTGKLVFKSGQLPVHANRLWLRQFCINLKNADFYVSSYACDTLDTFFQKLTDNCTMGMTQCCGSKLEDYTEPSFLQCIDQQYSFYDMFYMLASTPGLKALKIQARTNFPSTQKYQESENIVNSLGTWTENQMKGASSSFAGFWMAEYDEQFQFFDLQNALFVGTKISLGIAVAVAFLVILLTSQNIILSFFSVATILFIISVTVGILVGCGWKLNIVESTVFSVAAGLSADFTLHYSIAYRASIFKDDRKGRTADALSKLGPPIFMGALTTFVSGLVMYPSTVLAYRQFGTFLMVVMFVSLLYSNFFFLPLLTVIGPTNNLGQIPSDCCKKQKELPPNKEHEPSKQGSVNL